MVGTRAVSPAEIELISANMHSDQLKNFTLPFVLIASFLGLGGCFPLVDVFGELEETCKAEAKIVVHDQPLWREFVTEGNANFESRASEYPETHRIVAEYALGFDRLYGPSMEPSTLTVDGKVVRSDLIILKDGVRVADYVNFYARRDFAGRTISNCIAKFPDLYQETDALDV